MVHNIRSLYFNMYGLGCNMQVEEWNNTIRILNREDGQKRAMKWQSKQVLCKVVEIIL